MEIANFAPPPNFEEDEAEENENMESHMFSEDSEHPSFKEVVNMPSPSLNPEVPPLAEARSPNPKRLGISVSHASVFAPKVKVFNIEQNFDLSKEKITRGLTKSKLEQEIDELKKKAPEKAKTL